MLETETKLLTVSFPEVETDPSANVYMALDLTARPTGFKGSKQSIEVPLYADLKRHDMGPGLAEKIDEVGTGASVWMTKELWGVGQTGQYLHDGRATTLPEAILLHGGDAEDQRDDFVDLTDAEQADLVRFLQNLVILKAPEEE